jgi:hemoglobin-like flavoprotein
LNSVFRPKAYGGAVCDRVFSPIVTPDQIHLLRKSFSRFESKAQISILSFYRRLFELAPELRTLFRASIEEQSTQLVDMLSLAIHRTDRRESVETELRQLGARHVIYGVKDEYYDVFVRALMDTLAEVLGIHFTPAIRAAWQEFFDFTTGAMKRGAAIYLAQDAAQATAATARP